MVNEFAGKKLIVIGGTSGMGMETAKIVLRHGGEAVVVGRSVNKMAEALKLLWRHVGACE